MSKRAIGPFRVEAVGLGCMSLSHAYGVPPSPSEGAALLHQALDLGYDFLDTAALYGLGANETLIGEALAHRRGEYVLASKCGISIIDGKRIIDGRPQAIRAVLEDSLRRLRTDVIDLYYLHRWDKAVPIEDSVGALADAVREGKIRSIGLSEVSAATLRRAHAVHPIAALQTEYSLMTRNPEVAVLDACGELGVAFVAFSPVGRGILGGVLRSMDALPPADLRHIMPRFNDPQNFAANLALADRLAAVAREAGLSPAQLAIAWTLGRGDHVVSIPGTANPRHLAENIAARGIRIDAALAARLDDLINPDTVQGPRYPPLQQSQVDTEELPA